MKTFLSFVCAFLIVIATNSYAQSPINNFAGTNTLQSRYNVSATERVKVYPNPSSTGQVSVMFTGLNIKNDVLLVDALGQNVQQWNGVSTNRMNINNLRKGVYTLIIRDRQYNTQINQKIIIL